MSLAIESVCPEDIEGFRFFQKTSCAVLACRIYTVANRSPMNIYRKQASCAYYDLSVFAVFQSALILVEEMHTSTSTISGSAPHR